MSALRFIVATLLVGAGLVGLVVLLNALGYCGEAAQVAREEFGPREALRRYEWFKDAAAALDEKRATVEVYESRRADLAAAYEGMPRSGWAREDREQYSLWSSEVAGVKASFNQLAGEYNAAMAKFNYRYANRGMLPEGAEEPLPREYKPYVTE